MTGASAAPDAGRIAAELDAGHERARLAYHRRDAAAYMATFHPELAYGQPDGRTIGRDRLARDVRAQLARLHAATLAYRRESLEVEGPDAATEVVEQEATLEMRAFFGLLRRTWTLRRRGRYGWVRTAAGGWQIRRVEVLAEELRRGRR